MKKCSSSLCSTCLHELQLTFLWTVFNMEDDEKSDRAKIDLLHPEILSKDGLIVLLQEKNVPLVDPESLNKEALVDMYYKSILPLPQRKHRLNRRGREITKRQILTAKRQKITAPGQKESTPQNTYTIGKGDSVKPAVTQKPCATKGILKITSPKSEQSTGPNKTSESTKNPVTISPISIINKHIQCKTVASKDDKLEAKSDGTILGKRSAGTNDSTGSKISKEADALKTKFKRVQIKWP
ncbi:unnamed protein product [Owenia fusiformis]|uniref:Ashwin n=1 Tax=Owenia fusiformis TaxID=6347 RepID=A0A8J1XII9_OWEFU|nr:unnamed protein product [Owenia fusiformis]